MTYKVIQWATGGVGKAAIEAGVSGLFVYSTFQHNNDPERLRELIDKMRWEPKYLPLVAK